VASTASIEAVVLLLGVACGAASAVQFLRLAWAARGREPYAAPLRVRWGPGLAELLPTYLPGAGIAGTVSAVGLLAFGRASLATEAAVGLGAAVALFLGLVQVAADRWADPPDGANGLNPDPEREGSRAAMAASAVAAAVVALLLATTLFILLRVNGDVLVLAGLPVGALCVAGWATVARPSLRAGTPTGGLTSRRPGIRADGPTLFAVLATVLVGQITLAALDFLAIARYPAAGLYPLLVTGVGGIAVAVAGVLPPRGTPGGARIPPTTQWTVAAAVALVGTVGVIVWAMDADFLLFVVGGTGVLLAYLLGRGSPSLATRPKREPAATRPTSVGRWAGAAAGLLVAAGVVGGGAYLRPFSAWSLELGLYGAGAYVLSFVVLLGLTARATGPIAAEEGERGTDGTTRPATTPLYLSAAIALALVAASFTLAALLTNRLALSFAEVLGRVAAPSPTMEIALLVGVAGGGLAMLAPRSFARATWPIVGLAIPVGLASYGVAAELGGLVGLLLGAAVGLAGRSVRPAHPVPALSATSAALILLFASAVALWLVALAATAPTVYWSS
jgi:hypothetical protein